MDKLFKIKVFSRILPVLLLVGLAGCGTYGSVGGGAGLTGGSTLGAQLSRAERQQAETAAQEALGGSGNAPISWAAPNGTRGTVTPGVALVADLVGTGEVFRAPAGLHVDTSLETGLGKFRVLKNANVRLGPGTDYGRVAGLKQGTVVEALGRAPAEDWYLVARGGTIVGYIFGTLVERTGAGSLVLAGGPTVRPTYCRSFTQALKLKDGRGETWSGTACRARNGRWGLDRTRLAGM